MNRSRPRVSIGLPVRNGARYLGEAVDSLLRQNYTDFELIISDNASTDETEAMCRDYAARDPRVRYYRSDQNVGLANNYNYLFMRARGDYFKWAAADDVHEPDYVGRCLEVLEHDPAVVLAYTKARFIDEDGGPVAESDPGFDLQSDTAPERFRYVIHSSSWVNAIFGLIRAKSLANTRLLPSYPGGDFSLLGELAMAGKFVEVPDPLFLRRLHPEASSQNTHDVAYLVHLWTATGQRSFPAWSRRRDEFATIMNSNLRAWEKLSLGTSLLRSMVTTRRRLFTEFVSRLRV
jgi:glycosyltransferase involved in cell wall biosynthesis